MHHHPQPEAVPGPSGQGTVVLDVGGTRGALILFTTDALEGEEIEIRPMGGRWDGTHTAVRRRDLRDAVAFAGVFGSLPEGEYQVRIKGPNADRAGPRTTVDVAVAGGEVTERFWPDA